MKISLNWLSEFIDLTLDNDSLSDLLTMAGVEVEGIESRGGDFPSVVVARILESTPHPNADRLSVCKVDDGSGTPRQIVCGAKNYRVGDHVPLALPGAVLPGDFKIKRGKLRGVESDGMLCSASELRLAEDAEGLLLLPADSRVGAPIGEVIPADTIFDLEITPNRPDLLSHIGIARELSALTRHHLVLPEFGPLPDQDDALGVRIDAPDICPLYTARRIRGVRVGPSPDWLARRLEAVGLRSINNVVDITNYVLLETGQPLHAFDAAKLNGAIRVRRATEGEPFLALDGRSYPLASEHLLIADSKEPVALAGVMGGEATGVTESTVDLILESAEFLPSSVRHTSRGLGLISDSSYRFERGIDRAGVISASCRAVNLILELAGGEADPGIAIAGDPSPEIIHVEFRPDRCHRLLGDAVSDEEIARILLAFGLGHTADCEGGSVWEIPSFRRDLTREIDLIEEIARVHGLERIPRSHRSITVGESQADRAYDFAMRMRRTLQGLGLHETRTLTLIAESSLADDVFGEGALLRVKNPLGEESAALRPSLLPGLVRTAAFNARQGAESIRIFEIGRVFRPGTPEESTRLGIALAGTTVPSGWRDATPRPVDFLDLKGVLEQLGVPDLELRRKEKPGAAIAAEMFAGEVWIGCAGQLRPKRARELDIRGALLVAELDLDALHTLVEHPVTFAPWPRLPSVRRDIAMVLPQGVTHRKVEDLLHGAKEPLLECVEVFDIYTDPAGEKVPSDMKSVAYALTYRSKERTLNSDEVNVAHARLKERLQSRLGAQLRE